MEPTINIKTEKDEIRIGEALQPKHPENINIIGNIDAPFCWLKNKMDAIEIIKCHCLVNRDERSIKLVVNDKLYTKDVILGKMVLSPIFEKFGINSGRTYETWKLAEFFKMNRSFFKSKEDGMKLVAELNNFEAKINKELENKRDDRANSTYKKSQVVQTNIPTGFILNIPIIKGLPNYEIEVEICIEPANLLCSLVSPGANDILAEIVENTIDMRVSDLIQLTEEKLTIIEI